MRRPYQPLRLAILVPALLLAQPLPKFDVASIKPTLHPRVNGQSHSSIDVPTPGYLDAENSTLQALIEFAFDIKPYQVSGPQWLNDETYSFDVSAKAAPGRRTSSKQVRQMLQSLLAERFHLETHRELRPLSAYELIVGPRGAKLDSAKEDTGARSGVSSAGGEVSATGVSMPFFAEVLSGYLKYPVLDRTGLKGSFDFKLRYDPGDSGAGPSIFTAVEEQLGLQLRAAKAPVDTIVVDRADRSPTPN